LAELPSGTVTFLFTDLEVSTRLWDREPDAMRDALARHDEILRESIARHDGYVVKGRGDGVHAAFATAEAALRSAIDTQVIFDAEQWTVSEPLRVRIGLNTGTAELRDGDYFGSAVNRAARLMDLAHGGQIVCSQSTADLARDDLPNDVTLVDLGEHRLRDLTRVERVFQLSAPELRTSFPALRSLESFTTNLTSQVTPFVGRERELADAAAMLTVSRVVTLTGVGGVGKTRLAIQVGAEALPDFPDGVFVVELGGVNDGNAIDESIASTLSVQQQPGHTITESLHSFLGDKRILVVLDNCEHLLEPVARLVARMVTASPGVRILATSREALLVEGEQVMTVPSLDVPDETTSAELLGASESVRLFVDRAHATRPEFRLTAENAPAVGQLCRRLDGIPLAIELAAARVRSMAPGEIAARLDQRFRLLTGGTRTAASRHQTLRAAIDWSYDALEPSDQSLLGRLAVCAGGFDLAAAEAIGAGAAIDAFDVDDALGRLVDKHLVQVSEVGGKTRYKMLETIREYAFGRLDATGDTEDARSRHAAHYVAFVEQAGRGLKGPDERAWLERVEEEADNLRAAVTWSLASADTKAAAACVYALGLHGLRIDPMVATWADAVIASGLAAHEPAYPAVLAVAAWARFGEGRTEEATRLSEVALAQLDRLETPPLVVCQVLTGVTGIEMQLGENPTGHARTMLRAATEARDDYETARALLVLANAQYMTGDAGALDTAEESVRVAYRCGSPTDISFCLFNLAMICADTTPDRALELLEESRSQALAAGNTYAEITVSGMFGSLLIRADDHLAAAATLFESANHALRSGRHEQEANLLSGVAVSLASLGRHEPAAVVLGWVQAVLGVRELNLYIQVSTDGAITLSELPARLGQERYDSLWTQGADMNPRDILDYVREHLPA
jgi:predicted ATPase